MVLVLGRCRADRDACYLFGTIFLVRTSKGEPEGSPAVAMSPMVKPWTDHSVQLYFFLPAGLHFQTKSLEEKENGI